MATAKTRCSHLKEPRFRRVSAQNCSERHVIISNCVINLSADEDRVLQEAFRVLKPGGRIADSDVVTRGAIAPEIRQSVLLWVGCVAGALGDEEYRSKLSAAGFEQIDIEMTAHWGVPDPAAVRGSEAEVERAFREAFFILERRISLLLCLPLETLDSLALKRELDNIGQTMTPISEE